MNPSREESIAISALELPESERKAFLVRACGGDDALLRRVEALLAVVPPSRGMPAPCSEAHTPTLLADSAPAKPQLHSEEKLGRYRIRELIGEGGCGVVYVAEQTEPVRREVAVKVIKMGMDTKQVVARFEAERQALAMMDHPCIAKVLDAGATESGRPFFVMELIRGLRITTYCDRERLDVAARLDLFIKVCQAIQHAHQKGIIHRDIKPSNILVAAHDNTAVPKVIDFGIAKATGGRLTDSTVFTQLHQFIGTPAYMSPEQVCLGTQDIDTRTDIYSLGVVLYELLCGVPPFDPQELIDSGLEGIRRIIQERDPVRPSVRLEQRRRESPNPFDWNTRDDVPADLDWIVLKCLEKDRNRRYETANGLAMDIVRFLNHEPVLARSPTTVYRLKKAWRRNRGMFATGITVGFSLCIASAVSTTQWITASRAQAKAEKAESAERRARLAADAEREKSLQLLYAANIQLIQQAWEQNNLGRMRLLLNETASYRDRGFEWDYWNRVAHQAEHTLRGHQNSVWGVAYSPDGRWLASASEDGTARIWDVATRREIQVLPVPGGKSYGVTFSPDGSLVASANEDGSAILWDSKTGREIRRFVGHQARVYSVNFSPDGRTLATASEDQTVRLWNVADGRERLHLTGHKGWVRSAVFSPDGRHLASAGDDYIAILWDADSGKELRRLTGHQNRIYSVAWAPSGASLATASWDATIGLWDPNTGSLVRSLKGHSSWVRSVQYSPDGQRLVSSGEDQTARVWDLSTGQELLQLKGHSLRVRWAVFSPDGSQVATAGGDNTVRLWQSSGQHESRKLHGHRSWVRSVATTADGKILVTAANDLSGRVWDLETGNTLLVLRGHTQMVNAVDVSPDGTEAATASSDDTVRIWGLGNGKERLRIQAHTGGVNSIAYAPDGARIVTGGSDSTARIWDVRTGTEMVTLRGVGKLVPSVCFSPDGRRVATASDDALARVWDASTGKLIHELKGHQGTVQSIQFSPDGTRIATAAEDKCIRVWDSASGSALAVLRGHSDVVLSVNYSPDGRRLLSSSTDQTARLWDASNGRELTIFRGHDGWVLTARFSRDGRRVITGGFDQAVLVWDAASPEQAGRWAIEEADPASASLRSP